MCVVVTTVSFLVHVFSVDYMASDPYKIKFFAFISLFTFFMLVLVCSNNFLVLFCGWEGVGLCSYLLISFWDTRVQALKAANKALFINKLGDFFFMVAISAVLFLFKSLDFEVIFSLASQYVNEEIFIFGVGIPVLSFISFFLLLAAMAKSAQLFLHTWLPDAMEGPTPVSALIHAATMVTAGIFLIIRCSFIIDFCPFVLNTMVYVGCATLVVSGLIALFQNDIKKIVAYSTCSQLGYMLFSCGISGYNLALFHLFNHAFFKALLFLACGSLIHSLRGEQDIRKMGGLHNRMPLTYTSFLIGSASLIGVPFFSGFFSKDSILELAYVKLCNPAYFHLYFFSLAGVALTVLYSLKLIFFSFFSSPNGFKNKISGAKESESFFNAFPLMILTVLSIFSGFLFNFFFVTKHKIFFENSIFVSTNNDLPAQVYGFVPSFVHFFPIVIIVAALFCFILYYGGVRKEINFRLFIKTNFYRRTYLKNYEKYVTLFNKKLFIDDFYNIIALSVYKLSYTIFRTIDKGVLEFLGPRGLVNTVYNLALDFNKRFQSGFVYQYTLIILLNIFFILFLVLLLV